MNVPNIILALFGLGIASAFAWVALWTVLLPEAFGLYWAGYKGLTVFVFLLGCFAPAAVKFFPRP